MLENEEKIIEKAKVNSRYFGIIFDEYYTTIFNYIFRRINNAHQARDITSEVFFKALSKLHSFKWQNISILNWLYRIASSEIALYFRNPNQQCSSYEFLKELNVQFRAAEGLEEEILQAEEQMELHREFQLIQKQLLELPVRDQEVIALRFFESRKIREIASILDISEDIAKATLYRALEKLKKSVTKAERSAFTK